MRALRIGAVVGGVLLLGVAGLFVAARFADGPLGPIPGGPLASGAWVEQPVADWRFAADRETVELQLVGDDTSRTVWILVRPGGDAYVPASLAFPPGKTWHRRAEAGPGHAVIRIEGRRYPVTLTRVGDPALQADLSALVDSKYGAAPPGEGVWFFAVTPRDAEEG